jgi:hypothetical protein
MWCFQTMKMLGDIFAQNPKKVVVSVIQDDINK